ncbi:hypothetical protein H696_03875 [Fonticula alba]|uniref:Uncharacterized protein n=1 Tax=Fonticula alba TaxID=691883 RepID=A0A058Z5R6_FONAL|nr:hypothetical protein H696_03875 [Fonticula alba]KCV69446.1 hypothetical protein H696_03875 [Fonticula alba]|eukprot:XP_009496011.1 hypothetical protein H696_03875 [Fonticula alba]
MSNQPDVLAVADPSFEGDSPSVAVAQNVLAALETEVSGDKSQRALFPFEEGGIRMGHNMPTEQLSLWESIKRRPHASAAVGILVAGVFFLTARIYVRQAILYARHRRRFEMDLRHDRGVFTPDEAEQLHIGFGVGRKLATIGGRHSTAAEMVADFKQFPDVQLPGSHLLRIDPVTGRTVIGSAFIRSSFARRKVTERSSVDF